MRLPHAEVAGQLARQLHALDFTVEGVQSRLGPEAAAALERGSTVVAGQVLRGDTSPLATVVRLFLLAQPVTSTDLAAALPVDLELSDLLVTASDGHVRSSLELAPHAADGDWLLASDWAGTRTGRRVAADHVLGAGGASLMLAQCTVRPSASRALDLGTGCGIQAVHLSRHCETVVGTDVSRRCLDVAEFNLAMNDIVCDLRHGSLFDPVADERFDLIVSNPPFVIGSPRSQRYDYRDSGLPGDEVCGRIVAGAEHHLSEGGWCQLLANWEIHADDDWWAAPAGWLSGSCLDAWVVQREVQDPAAYVETWLHDAGVGSQDEDDSQYADWYSGLRARGVVGVGFGLVSLRSGGLHHPVRRFQHASQPLDQPVGGEVERWFARQDRLRFAPASEVLLMRVQVAADVRVDLRLRPGVDEPEELLALRESGFRWTATLDQFGVEVLGQIDPEHTLGEAVAAVAEASGIEVAEALTGAIPVLRRMIEEGFLEPLD